MNHVVLVGLPGTGKSTVAPLLAERLGCGHVDVDDAVEQRLGMDVARAFAQLGEARFRSEERLAMEAALASADRLVIAAGGGLIAQDGAVELLGRNATVVCLDADEPELARRVGADGGARPLLGSSPEPALRHLRAARSTVHASAQLHVATGDRTPRQLAEAIASALSGAVRVGAEALLQRPPQPRSPHRRR